MSDFSVDVIVLGGGLVGLTTANQLAEKGFTVAVVEKNAFQEHWDLDTFDVRATAISPASKKWFEKLGVFEKIPPEHLGVYDTMHVWDGLGFGEIRFDAAEVNEPYLGYILENREILKALHTVAKGYQNLYFLNEKEPVGLKIIEGSVFLTLTKNTLLKAPLIIGADGAHSWLRQIANIPVKQKDYAQHALVATVKTEYPHQKRACQVFLQEGPLAFLPFNDPHTHSIVWTNQPQTTERLMALSEPLFCSTLAEAFQGRLGRVLSVQERRFFPLQRLHAESYVADRLALVGDAIHVVHPLAGQGVNLGLKDAQQLCQILSLAREKGHDIGDPRVLRRYQRVRKGAVFSTLMGMDFLNGLFQTKTTLALGLRGMGLNMFDRLPILKNKMALHAMGLI